MRIEEDSARRLVLRFAPGPGRAVALGIGAALMLGGLAMIAALDWHDGGMGGIVFLLMGALPAGVAFTMGDWRTTLDRDSGIVTVERRPLVGAPVRHAVPLAEVLAPARQSRGSRVPAFFDRAAETERRTLRREGKPRSDDVFANAPKPKLRHVVLRMTPASGRPPLEISPGLPEPAGAAAERKLRDWLPRRPNDDAL